VCWVGQSVTGEKRGLRSRSGKGFHKDTHAVYLWYKETASIESSTAAAGCGAAVIDLYGAMKIVGSQYGE